MNVQLFWSLEGVAEKHEELPIDCIWQKDEDWAIVVTMRGRRVVLLGKEQELLLDEVLRTNIEHRVFGLHRNGIAVVLITKHAFHVWQEYDGLWFYKGGREFPGLVGSAEIYHIKDKYGLEVLVTWNGDQERYQLVSKKVPYSGPHTEWEKV